jgi:hypothetical protein
LIRTSNFVVTAAIASALGACGRSAAQEHEKPVSTTSITSAELEAQKEAAEAILDWRTSREEYRRNLTLGVQSMDRTILHLERRAKVAERRNRAVFDATLPRIRARRADLQRDLPLLDLATQSTWEATRTRLDRDWDALMSAMNRAPIAERELHAH